MKWFGLRTFLEVVNQVMINMVAAWFIVAFVTPGIFGTSSIQQYFGVLLQNLPFGILGLIFCSALAEKIKSL